MGDVSKLLAFVRARSKGEFVFAEAMVATVLAELKRLAQEADITVEVVSPDEERLALFTAGGAIVGGVAGLAFAGPYGLLLGVVLGAAGGYAAAHVVVKIELADGRGRLIIE